MKKVTSPADVEAYLAAVPEPARTTLNAVRAAIRAAAPKEATEGLSYGMPAFKLKSPLAGYAASAGHCGYYPMSSSVIDALKEDLADYETSKGTIRFPIDQPLPAPLIKKLVKARLAEIEAKKGT